MNFQPALTSSKSKFFLYLLAIAITAFAAFSLGAEASQAAKAKASGGVSTGGGATGSSKSSDGSSEYDRLYEGLPAGEKKWARSTSECESGGDPNAIGGGGMYRGAFQFLKSTWKASPKSPGGDPIAHDYKTQAVVAVALKKRDGAGHWPVCG